MRLGGNGDRRRRCLHRPVLEIDRPQLLRAIGIRLGVEPPCEHLGLLALLERDVFVHLRQRGARLRQSGAVSQRQQRIGSDPVLLHQIAVEMGNADQILRARIAAIGGGADIGHRLLAAAILEQQQTVIVRCLDMALRRGGSVERFGLARIGFDPAPEAIGLCHVELRIGIALRSRTRPFAHRSGIIARRPGFDSLLHIGQRRSGTRHQQPGQRQGASSQAGSSCYRVAHRRLHGCHAFAYVYSTQHIVKPVLAKSWR